MCTCTLYIHLETPRASTKSAKVLPKELLKTLTEIPSETNTDKHPSKPLTKGKKRPVEDCVEVDNAEALNTLVKTLSGRVSRKRQPFSPELGPDSKWQQGGTSTTVAENPSVSPIRNPAQQYRDEETVQGKDNK